MCYGGCDCIRCMGEPPVINESDRQQCSDDSKKFTSKRPMVIFKQDYEGFEAMYDIGRDVAEAFDTDFNPAASVLPDEHQGTVTVTITYTPEKS